MTTVSNNIFITQSRPRFKFRSPPKLGKISRRNDLNDIPVPAHQNSGDLNRQEDITVHRRTVKTWRDASGLVNVPIMTRNIGSTLNPLWNELPINPVVDSRLTPDAPPPPPPNIIRRGRTREPPKPVRSVQSAGMERMVRPPSRESFAISITSSHSVRTHDSGFSASLAPGIGPALKVPAELDDGETDWKNSKMTSRWQFIREKLKGMTQKNENEDKVQKTQYENKSYTRPFGTSWGMYRPITAETSSQATDEEYARSTPKPPTPPRRPRRAVKEAVLPPAKPRDPPGQLPTFFDDPPVWLNPYLQLKRPQRLSKMTKGPLDYCF